MDTLKGHENDVNYVQFRWTTIFHSDILNYADKERSL